MYNPLSIKPEFEQSNGKAKKYMDKRGSRLNGHVNSFIENSPLGFYQTTPAGKILAANTAFVQLLGYNKFEDVQHINLNKVYIGPTFTRKEFINRLKEHDKIVGLEYEWKKKNGSIIYVRENTRAIKKGGKTLYYEGTIEDITDRKTAELELQKSKQKLEEVQTRLTFLDEMATKLAESVSYKVRLKKLAQMLVPRISDWCGIDILSKDGTLNRVAVAHINSDKVALAQELSEKYSPDPDSNVGIWGVIKNNKPELYSHIPQDLLISNAKDERHREILLQLGLHSVIIVPLSARERNLGAIILANSESRKAFTQSDLAFAQEIANRVAYFVDNARLFTIAQKELTRRKQIEKMLRERANQQYVAAKFGQKVLGSKHTYNIIAEALTTITKTLHIQHTTYSQFVKKEDKFLVSEGTGWRKGVVKKLKLDNGKKSLSGYTLLSNGPVTVKNFLEEKRFEVPKFLMDHSLTSGMTVIVHSGKMMFGVIGVYSSEERTFTRNDINFLQTIANSLASVLERKRIDDALVKSENRFRSIFNYALEPIMMLNDKGGIAEANAAATELMGIKREKLLTMNISDLVTEETKSITLKRWKAFLKDGKQRGELTIQRNDGLRTLEYSSVANIILGYHLTIIRDITERKEEEQRRNHFLGIASHELKNALAGVKSFNQLLERKLKQTDDKNLEYVKRIDTNVDRLKRLIDDLMDMTKLRAGKLELVKDAIEINTLVKEVVEEMQHTSNTHQITLQTDPPIYIVGDTMRLRQVITNLIRNAIKYSPQGNEVFVSSEKNNDHVKIIVKDFGEGIAKKDQKKIFDLFYRAENSQTTTGMGVGLYISSEIIKMHGGKIGVKSIPHKGSTFYFTLPVIE